MGIEGTLKVCVRGWVRRCVRGCAEGYDRGCISCSRMHEMQINCTGRHGNVVLPAPVGPVNTTNSPARNPLHISDRRGNEGDCEPAKTGSSRSYERGGVTRE